MTGLESSEEVVVSSGVESSFGGVVTSLNAGVESSDSGVVLSGLAASLDGVDSSAGDF